MKKSTESFNKSDYTEEEWRKKFDELLEKGEPFIGRISIPEQSTIRTLSSTYEYILHLLEYQASIEINMSKYVDGMGVLQIDVSSNFSQDLNDSLQIFFREYISYEIGVTDIFEVITNGRYKFYLKDGEINIHSQLDLFGLDASHK